MVPGVGYRQTEGCHGPTSGSGPSYAIVRVEDVSACYDSGRRNSSHDENAFAGVSRFERGECLVPLVETEPVSDQLP